MIRPLELMINGSPAMRTASLELMPFRDAFIYIAIKCETMSDSEYEDYILKLMKFSEYRVLHDFMHDLEDPRFKNVSGDFNRMPSSIIEAAKIIDFLSNPLFSKNKNKLIEHKQP